MIGIRDIRDYIASLGIAEDEHCYCGKMADKKEKSIGIYPSKQGGNFKIPLGGMERASYGEQAVTILVHWNRSLSETEQAAAILHKSFLSCRQQQVNGYKIKFIFVRQEHPIPIGTDDNGIFEYVIESKFYYER